MSAFLHIGLYGYRDYALERYVAAGPCPEERTESLEQLRALSIGLRMGVVLTEYHPDSIDTREDYDAFIAKQAAEG
jgi:3-deoxy-manno-octulosonate cytidylyltransferase (CMP-KDO synthetase)